MKRKVQRFRLLLVGLAILIGGGIAWASTAGSGSPFVTAFSDYFGASKDANYVAPEEPEGQTLGEDPYDAALAAITDGDSYRIFTDIGGINYYLNNSGKLVSDVKMAASFIFTAVWAEGTLYETGWNLGCKFTNPSLDGGSTGNIIQKGGINVGSNDRNDWERQVFFKNAEGKYAIRSTNANSANWGANTYWDAVTYEELPAAGYSLEASYVWQIEENVDNRPAAWNKTLTWGESLYAIVGGGVLTKGEEYTSNAKDPQEGSYEALCDGDYATFFHSTWHGGEYDPLADHYLQVELPEAMQDFFVYFKKRSQNNNNRPTTILVSGSNDGEEFTELAVLDNLPSGATPIDYLSDKISAAEAYKYLRFTVTATNNGQKTGDHVFFTFSEFNILPVNDLLAEAAPLMYGDYTDLDDEDVAKIDAFDAKLAALSRYADAMAAIENGGNYSISTEFGGEKYYLTADGTLTQDLASAGAFTFTKVAGVEYPYGFYVDAGKRFTNAPGTNESVLKIGNINVTDGNRADWEAQVFFMNEEGKFAVRSTNAGYAASGWGWIGSAYWTVDEVDGEPVAQYSFDQNFIWTLEDNSLVNVTYCLVVNGEIIATESITAPVGFVPTAPASLNEAIANETHGLYTLKPDVEVITAETSVVNFTPEWGGIFEYSESFEDAKWYNMTIRSNYWVAMDETEPYYPKADKDLNNLNSYWAFKAVEGEPLQVVIMNAAAGEGKSLSVDGDNVVMRDGECKWDIYSNSDGFVMRPVEGGENDWVNQNGGSSGPLAFWKSTGGRTDNGSTFRVQEAAALYAISIAETVDGFVEADKAEAPAGSTVTLTLTPDEGKVVDEIIIQAGEETIEYDAKKFTFVMPASDVIITATFKDTPEVYIETDLTAQFPIDWQGWDGATGFVGWAAPAVVTNDGRETPACEKYEGTCEPTGEMFTRTLTGLANGTYNIELYGAAAYTSGRGFESELVEGDETAVYLFAETPAGKVQQFIPAHVATEFNSTGIATALLENVEVTDGTITIGMFKEKPLTNWHVVQIKGVTAKVKAADVLAATVVRAVAYDTSLLSDALTGKLAQAIEDNNGVYDTPEEYLAAVNAIEAVLAEADIYVVAAPKLEQMKKLVDATNFYTAEAYAEYYGIPKQKLDEGTLTMAEANALQDPYEITSWHSDITADNFLLSVWDTNPDFVDAPYYINTWSVEGEDDGSEFKVPFFEYWTGDDNSLDEKTLTATIEGLEAGQTALVNIWVRVRAKNDTDAADATGVTLQVNDGEAVDVTEGETFGQFNLAKYAAVGVVDEEGKLVVQFNVAADNNISWLSFQNAQYSFVDPELLDYATALYTIKDGAKYNITTNVYGETYYLTPEGELTADAANAGIFNFQKVQGEQYEYGFLLNSQNNTRFSNPSWTSEDALTNGRLNTTSDSRSTWDAQVFFYKDGKFAVRSTNAAYNGQESGWSWIGNTYWAVHEGPLAEYGWEKSYDWELQEVNTVEVTYVLYDAESGEAVQAVVVTQKSNSEVVIPAAFTSVAFYDYYADGFIGNENCTIEVIRVQKPGLIFDLDDLSNSKAYTIACDRGALLTKDGFLASTAHSSLKEARASKFAIINYEDNYYLYSIADGMFVTNSGVLAKVPTNGVEDAIKIDPMAAPYFMYYFTIDGADCGLNTNGNDPYGYVINTWMTADAGNQYYMIEAADFDPTEALARLKMGDVDLEWDAPEVPVLEDINVAFIEPGKSYFIKNVGAGQFLTGSNSWSTQISLTRAGIADEFSPALSIYVADSTAILADTQVTGLSLRLNGSFTVNGGSGKRLFTNTYLFRDGDESGFIDHGSQERGYIWNITQADNGFYRIQTADGDPAFPDASIQYAGWDSSYGAILVDEEGNLLIDPETGMEGSTAVKFDCEKDVEEFNIDWAFIDPTDYLIKLEIYEARKALYNVLISTLYLDYTVDTSAATEVYNDPSATKAELEAATAALKTAINRAYFESILAGASEYEPIDATGYVLENPDFETGDISGWTTNYVNGQQANNIGYQGSSYTSDGIYISRFIEAWKSESNPWVIGDGYLQQTVYGLPAGKYILEADAISVYQWADHSGEGGIGKNPAEGVFLFIQAGEYEATTTLATGNGQPKHFSVTYIHDGSDVLTFGLKTVNATANWIAADNFRLTYYGNDGQDIDYSRALATINDGASYRIFTEVDGTKYYLNPTGRLVDNAQSAATFNFSQVYSDNMGVYEYGYHVETNGLFFSNAPDYYEEYLKCGYINQNSDGRNTWEAQVFFLNEDGKFAVRSTNAPYSDSGWGWIGSAYWTADETEEGLVAQYSFDKNFIWQLEEHYDNRPELFQIVQQWPYQLQNITGLVQDASLWTSNAKEPNEGSYEALSDGSYTTFFHSQWSGIGPDEDHYLQAELPEARSEFYVYFKKRSQNMVNRPTYINVSGSNDGENFEEITVLEDLPQGSTPIDYFSGVIKADNAYKYIRFTVPETNNMDMNNDHVFFTFSEFYILPADGIVAEAAPFMVSDYTELNEEDADVIYSIQEEINNYYHDVWYYLIVDGEYWADSWSWQANGQAPAIPDYFKDVTRGLYALKPDVDVITPNTYEVYVYAEWAAPFEFSQSYDDAKWYNMNIRSDYWVSMDESEPYYPSADADLGAEESQWAFLPVEGNPYAVKIINRAAGPDYYLVQDGDNVVMRDWEFEWDIYGNNNGFVIRLPWDDYGWVNQNGGSSGPLQFWYSSEGKTDDGSTFRVQEATEYSLAQDINVRNKKILNFTNRELPEDYKPNITLLPYEGWIGDTGTPSTLGALTVRTGEQTLSINQLVMNFSPARTNFLRWDWGVDNTYYIPYHTTLINEGSMRADNIDTRMTVTDGQWNFISLPYDVRVSDITCENEETDWVIRRYDGAARANLELDQTWVNVGADEVLEAGKGYILHCSYSPNWLYNTCVFHFPAMNSENKNLLFSSEDRAVLLEENQSEFAHNRSWNLIGNPFAAYIEIGQTDFEGPITVWNGNGNYAAFSPIDDNYILTPGEAFFVQRPVGQSSIVFGAEGRMSWYDAYEYVNNGFNGKRISARLRQTADRSVFNLILSDGEKSDRTRVVINPEAELEYEVNRDASKFAAMDGAIPQLSSTAAGVEYAINERPLSDGLVQLSARFGKTGDYTLRLETKAAESVILIDEVAGITVELNSVEEYHFTAQAGSAPNRFRLMINSNADGIAEVAAGDLAGARVYTLDGKLLPANKPTASGIYLIQKNGAVRKVSVK